MADNKFRIEIKDSQYRRVFLLAVLGLFCASIWTWQKQVIPYQLVIQSLLSFVFLAWFAQQIFRQGSQKVMVLHETGELLWLAPPDDTPWFITRKSRFNRYVIWLVLYSSQMQRQCTILVFKDSVSDVNWRHLCRIVAKNLRK